MIGDSSYTMESKIENRIYGRLRDTQAAEMAASRINISNKSLNGNELKKGTRTHI